MKAQRLKTFSDFLKRAEIIRHALLVIKNNESQELSSSLAEFRSQNFGLPFYELNLLENPNLKEEMAQYYDIDVLPSFIYFRGKYMAGKLEGLEQGLDFSRFLTTTIQLDK